MVAAMLIGYTGDPFRFPTSGHYAAYTGTAPIEFSSAGRVVHRLSRRGSRRLNHALHIVAVTQIRHAHSPGSHAAGRELGTMLTVRKSYRRVVRDALRRDTAELTRIERALRRNVQLLDNGALTNLSAMRAVLRARGVEPPTFGSRPTTDPVRRS